VEHHGDDAKEESNDQVTDTWNVIVGGGVKEHHAPQAPEEGKDHGIAKEFREAPPSDAPRLDKGECKQDGLDKPVESLQCKDLPFRCHDLQSEAGVVGSSPIMGTAVGALAQAVAKGGEPKGRMPKQQRQGDPKWKHEKVDPTVNDRDQERTNDAAHDGRRKDGKDASRGDGFAASLVASIALNLHGCFRRVPPFYEKGRREFQPFTEELSLVPIAGSWRWRCQRGC
jgi:hypothetical protein